MDILHLMLENNCGKSYHEEKGQATFTARTVSFFLYIKGDRGFFLQKKLPVPFFYRIIKNKILDVLLQS